jgi:hypothetical protein
MGRFYFGHTSRSSTKAARKVPRIAGQIRGTIASSSNEPPSPEHKKD